MSSIDSITLTNGGYGYSGQVFTTNGLTSPTFGIQCNGNAKINGQLIVNDKNIEDELHSIKTDMDDRLDTIEEKLGILLPNNDLESRWTKLRELRKQYKELEKECWEQEEVIRILRS